MDITPYVDNLRRDLVATAESASPEVREAAERLAMALGPAMRLALMEAVSQAAAEITAEMPAGGVDVRLEGRDLAFTVSTGAPVAPAATVPGPAASAEEDDEGGLARITLRIPESVKTRAEDKAAEAGQSLNTWLVNVVRAAVRDHAINVDVDLSSIPFFGGDGPFGRQGKPGRRMSGWV